MIIASNFVLADVAKGINIRSIDAEIIESAEGDLLKLEGNVIIKTDSVELWSDKALYDRSNQEISLEGNVRALSKNLSMDARQMKADCNHVGFGLSWKGGRSFRKVPLEIIHVSRLRSNTSIDT